MNLFRSVRSEVKPNSTSDLMGHVYMLIGAVLGVTLIAVTVAAITMRGPNTPETLSTDTGEDIATTVFSPVESFPQFTVAKDSPLPLGVLPGDSEWPYAVPLRDPGSMTDPVTTAEIWMDPACPLCGELIRTVGTDLEAAAGTGTSNVLLRPSVFMDGTYNTDSSLRAMNAWGCAMDAGRGFPFLMRLSSALPQDPATGWANEQFFQFASESGITDLMLDTFSQCVADGRYVGWAGLATQTFIDAGITEAPKFTIDGETLPLEQMFSSQAVAALLAGLPAPTPTPVAETAEQTLPAGEPVTTSPNTVNTPVAVASPAAS